MRCVCEHRKPDPISDVLIQNTRLCKYSGCGEVRCLLDPPRIESCWIWCRTWWWSSGVPQDIYTGQCHTPPVCHVSADSSAQPRAHLRTGGFLYGSLSYLHLYLASSYWRNTSRECFNSPFLCQKIVLIDYQNYFQRCQWDPSEVKETIFNCSLVRNWIQNAACSFRMFERSCLWQRRLFTFVRHYASCEVSCGIFTKVLGPA